MAQSKLYKHGYQMANLREICAMTKGIRQNSGYHIEIAWDSTAGRICIEEHVGLVGSFMCKWVDGIVPCGYLTCPMTQQEIADQVVEAITGNILP